MKRPTLLHARPRDGLIGPRGFALARAGAAPGEQILTGLELDLRSKLLGREGFQDIADRSHLGISEGGVSLTLDGIADRVDCGNSAGFRITSNWVLGCWFKSTGGVQQTLAAKYRTADNERAFRLWWSATDQFSFYISTDGIGTGGSYTLAYSKWMDDLWHFMVAVSRDSDSVRAYIDAQQAGGGFPAAPMFNSAANLYLGAHENGTAGNWNGQIAGAFMYAPRGLATWDELEQDIEWAYRLRKLPHQRLGSALVESDLVADYGLNHQFSDADLTFIANAAPPGKRISNQQLENPGLEAPYSSGVANSWLVEGSPNASEYVGDPHSGSSAQRMNLAGGGNSIYQLKSVVRGELYHFGGWVKGLSVGTGLGAQFNIMSQDNQDILASTSLVSAVQEWAYYEQWWRSDRTGQVRFRLKSNGSNSHTGEAVFDDAFFYLWRGATPDSHAVNTAGGAAPTVFQPDIPKLTETGFTQYYRHNGGNTAWNVGDVPQLAFDRTDPFTLNAVVMLSDISHTGAIINKREDQSPSPGWQFRVEATGQLRFLLVNNATTNLLNVETENNVITANRPYFVTATYDGSSDVSGVNIYVNGLACRLTTADNSLTGSITNARPVQIGARDSVDHRIKGLLTEVSAFDVEFSADEVLELCNGGDPIDAERHTRAANLVGYWRNGWLSPSGQVQDRSLSGNDASMQGAQEIFILSARSDNSSRDALGGFVHRRDKMSFADNLPPLRVDVLGQNKVVGAEEESWWGTVHPSVSFSQGEAAIDFSGVFTALLQENDVLQVGDYYQVVVDVVKQTSGTCNVFVGNNSIGVVASPQRYTFEGEAITDGRVQFATSGFVATLNLNTYRVRQIPLADLFASGGSIYGWAFANGVGGGGAGRLFDKAHGGTSGYHVHLFDALLGFSKISFQRNTTGSAGLWRTTARDVIFGLPFFWGLTYTDGGDPTFYLGQSTDFLVRTVGSGLDELVTPTGSYDSNDDVVFHVGNRDVPNAGWNGSIYEVKANRYVMTEDEMRSLWEFGRSEYV